MALSRLAGRQYALSGPETNESAFFKALFQLFPGGQEIAEYLQRDPAVITRYLKDGGKFDPVTNLPEMTLTSGPYQTKYLSGLIP